MFVTHNCKKILHASSQPVFEKMFEKLHFYNQSSYAPPGGDSEKVITAENKPE